MDVTQIWGARGQRIMYGIAKRLFPGSPEFWDDMVQEGWLRLVETRRAPTSNADAFFRQIAANGMISYLRRERPAGVVVTFARAKHLGLLCCPSCASHDVAWTVFWPSLVRCRSCRELFAVEDTSVDDELDAAEVQHVHRLRRNDRRIAMWRALAKKPSL